MPEEKVMQLGWSDMMARHPGSHLIIAIAQDDEGAATADLFTQLFEAMQLPGVWALRAKRDLDVECAECVFGDKAAADAVATLLNARDIHRYPGWQSQREFRIDKVAQAALHLAMVRENSKNSPPLLARRAV